MKWSIFYVKENITCICRDDLENSKFDSIWIEIRFNHRRVLVRNYYKIIFKISNA